MEPMLERVRRGRARARPAPAGASRSSPTAAASCSAPSRRPIPPTGSRHVRRPVRFAAAVESLAGLGATTFLELGPGAALAAMVGEQLGEAARASRSRPCARARPEPDSLAHAIAAAHAAGAEVDWPAFFAGSGAGRVPLPTYPFQRSRYWLDSAAGAGDVGAAGLGATEHPLLSAAARAGRRGGGQHAADRPPLALDPPLAGRPRRWPARRSLPGTALLELALRAAGRGRPRADRGADPGGAAGPARAGPRVSSRSASPRPTARAAAG